MACNHENFQGTDKRVKHNPTVAKSMYIRIPGDPESGTCQLACTKMQEFVI